jgi:hypothetical protein
MGAILKTILTIEEGKQQHSKNDREKNAPPHNFEPRSLEAAKLRRIYAIDNSLMNKGALLTYKFF